MNARTVLAVCALALASATFSLAAEWDRKVALTFTKPVAVPAVHDTGWAVLPPGKYVFKVLEVATTRHVVQILSPDENKVYATITAIPIERMTPTDKVVITFRETPVGQPLELRTFFYPGRITGDEFVYPKAKATQVASLR